MGRCACCIADAERKGRDGEVQQCHSRVGVCGGAGGRRDREAGGSMRSASRLVAVLTGAILAIGVANDVAGARPASPARPSGTAVTAQDRAATAAYVHAELAYEKALVAVAGHSVAVRCRRVDVRHACRRATGSATTARSRSAGASLRWQRHSPRIYRITRSPDGLGRSRSPGGLRDELSCGTLKTMTFATVYADEGDLLDFHDDRVEARASVLAVVDKHPEVAEEFGLVELDESGRRVGGFMSGACLKAERERETSSSGPRAA